ncbi:hypothetical protein NDU88_006012 [Pleurodeles waltl]|uniref:Uncharacterized protein n=1 Tax=Pleurodeles waltl TaxID=8319 RepID=A0AAV7PJV9_PLEWA|nr:hypothetical protein NDU88_006012 [Pleurodeles waltl]
MQGKEYVEEEAISVLPIENKFRKAVDASIQQAVAAAIEPLERRLLQRKMEGGLDMTAFDKVKQAFAECPSLDGNPLSLLPSADPEEDN